MKKFLLKVLLFFALVVVMDFAFGFSWLRGHAKGGGTANREYIANRCEDDIIILGSSRATHHYIPKIIEDSLGLSCYNCGEEGNGIVLAYGRLKMLTERYKPKLILYEITPGYDYGTSEPNNRYLGYLRPYYDKDGIREIFDDFDDELSCLKMKSKMYQNSSNLLPYITNNLVYKDTRKGYEPLYGEMEAPKEQSAKIVNPMEIDSLKLSYLEKMIQLCQNMDIPLVFIVSPWYKYDEGVEKFTPAFEVCKGYEIPMYNMINEPSICNSYELFHDANHLNDKGASKYTQSILPIIRGNM